MVLVCLFVRFSSAAPITEELMADTAETARQAWNSWQEWEKENLPWLYRCEGPIGKLLDSQQDSLIFSHDSNLTTSVVYTYLCHTNLKISIISH